MGPVPQCCSRWKGGGGGGGGGGGRGGVLRAITLHLVHIVNSKEKLSPGIFHNVIL